MPLTFSLLPFTLCFSLLRDGNDKGSFLPDPGGDRYLSSQIPANLAPDSVHSHASARDIISNSGNGLRVITSSSGKSLCRKMSKNSINRSLSLFLRRVKPIASRKSRPRRSPSPNMNSHAFEYSGFILKSSLRESKPVGTAGGRSMQSKFSLEKSSKNRS